MRSHQTIHDAILLPLWQNEKNSLLWFNVRCLHCLEHMSRRKKTSAEQTFVGKTKSHPNSWRTWTRKQWIYNAAAQMPGRLAWRTWRRFPVQLHTTGLWSAHTCWLDIMLLEEFLRPRLWHIGTIVLLVRFSLAERKQLGNYRSLSWTHSFIFIFLLNPIEVIVPRGFVWGCRRHILRINVDTAGTFATWRDNFQVCFNTEVGSNLGRNKFTFRYDDKSQLLADAAAVVARRLLCTTAFKELIRAKFRRKVFFDSKSRGTILRMAYLWTGLRDSALDLVMWKCAGIVFIMGRMWSVSCPQNCSFWIKSQPESHPASHYCTWLAQAAHIRFGFVAAMQHGKRSFGAKLRRCFVVLASLFIVTCAGSIPGRPFFENDTDELWPETSILRTFPLRHLWNAVYFRLALLPLQHDGMCRLL